jgi:hypothetical protein
MFSTKSASMTLTRSFRFTIISRAIIGTFLLLFVLILSACGTSSSTTANTTATSTPATSVSQTADPVTPEATTTAAHYGTTTVYPIKVYFSKFPDSLNNFNAVFPVDRSSPSTAVATFSIQLLIAGPTLNERSAGYFSELNSILTGPSSCSTPNPTGGPDFTITLNMRGSKAQQGTATLRFCRITSSPGVGADARILAEINATLKQFSTIKDVAVLTQAGNCFGDESGLNNCLK